MVNENAIATYGSLMEEVKLRIEAIDLVLNSQISLRNKIAEELCYLQLRMICELTALSCLIIHGDVKGAQASQLQKAYQADWIMKRLQELHPQFYPQPIEANDIPSNPPQVVDVKYGYLTRADLDKLYHLCGSKLHRGRAKNILSGADVPNYAAIKTWRDKIIRLHNRHRIALIDGIHECWFVMQQEATGRVAWNIMKLVETQDMSPQAMD
jgi:hypothetical protein